jgi:F0F1-type ATP synthase membrane subunit c/vacuolar-type H+-ATPase subunit K
MDWLEQLFGLNPDGGDGSLETMVVAAAIGLALVIAGLVSGRVRARGLSALAVITRRSKTAR